MPTKMPLAKGLASGVPVGAVVAGEKAADILQPGNHGTTFGGNPLAMRAARETLRIVEEDGLLANAARVGEVLKGALAQALAGEAGVKEIRGQGLMLGIELDRPCGALALRALQAGLLISVTAGNVVRLLPPLIMREDEAREAVQILAPLIINFLHEAE
ncbi:MAG: aminotransferase class III-fold pyridoxal phosphate-dependent enzyme [Rhodocyclaceae bacterium]|nr:aminotransferase class III-fold pyridoxal phosphate-dependent enzyme [Rhodocyclaceae bacterium]